MRRCCGVCGVCLPKRTTMDELSVELKARELVNKVNPAAYPVSIDAYAAAIGAKISEDDELGDDEDGWSVERNGKFYIRVNKHHREERQRFTACHEIAHIVTGLPSEHASGPSWSYARRSKNEISCDIFASELLLPYKLFKPLVDDCEPCLGAIDRLAGDFKASTMATGSRFATFVALPCAFVLAEQGKVRYSARSRALRDANLWIPPRMDLPDGSLCRRLRDGKGGAGPEEIEPDLWFEDWERDGVLFEDARHLTKWDQTIALLWFEEEEAPPLRQDRKQREEEECGLAELDGVLPWPGRKKRK